MIGLRAATIPGVLALSLLSLAGCAPPSAQSHASAAAQLACRGRADEVYLRQNPASIYQADQYAASTRDAPYSSVGFAGNTSRGLPGQYYRDTLLDTCLDATNHQASATSAEQGPATQAPASQVPATQTPAVQPAPKP